MKSKIKEVRITQDKTYNRIIRLLYIGANKFPKILLSSILLKTTTEQFGVTRKSKAQGIKNKLQ